MEPDIILGPPGTGKTETLLTEVETLLTRGLEPEEIAFLTFTRRAAGEAVTRASEKFGFSEARFQWFRTIHSLCFRAGGWARGDVLAGQLFREFAEWSGVAFTSRSTWEEGWQGPEIGDRIMHLDNLSRVSGRELREVYDTTEHDLPWSEVRRVTRDMDVYKRTRGLVDYTDMLSHYIEGPQSQLGIKALLVDEAQDLSLLQWRVIEKIVADHPGLIRYVVAGDDDQAIFEWAGAAVDHFLRLPGRARVLGRSWRVPAAVQEIAAEVIGRCENRRPKEWAPRPEAGVVDREVGFGEVDVDRGDVLVLARNHIWLERDVAPVLRHEGVYYSLSGRPSIPAETLAAVRGWELWRRGEQIPAETARTLRLWLPAENQGREPTREEDMVGAAELGIKASNPWFEALKRMPQDEVSYILAARTRGETLTGSPRVRLSTIHGSKGGQADHVVLITDMTARSEREAQTAPDQETRVWYVGVTRAIEKLTIVSRPDAPRYFSL